MVVTLTSETKRQALSVAEADNEKFLDTSHLSSNLKQRAVRGGAATFGGQVIAKVFHLGTLMVLCRILTPRDFGLIAMITGVGLYKSIYLYKVRYSFLVYNLINISIIVSFVELPSTAQ